MPHPDQGIGVELVRALGAGIGRDVVFVWREPGLGLEQAVVDGACDMAPGVVLDPGPMARGGEFPGILLSRPYAAAGYHLIGNVGAGPVRSLAELGEMRIAVEATSVPIYTLKQRGHPVHALEDYDSVIRAVAQGRTPYGYLWDPIDARKLRDRSDVVMVEAFEPEERWDFGLAVRVEDTGLLKTVDTAVAELLRSGAVERTFAEYEVPYLTPEARRTVAGK